MKSGSKPRFDSSRARIVALGLFVLIGCGVRNEAASSAGEQHQAANTTSSANTASSVEQSKAVAPAAVPEVGRAVGTLTVDGQTVQIKFAYARKIKGRFDPTVQEIDLILTDEAVPTELLKDFRDMRDAFSSLRGGKRQGVYLYVGSEGQIRTRSPYHKALGGQSIASMSSKKEGFKIDQDRIAGRAEFQSEDFGHTWAYSISFHASLKD